MNEGIGMAQAIRGNGLKGLSAAKQQAAKDINSRCTEEGDCWLWDKSVNSSGYPQMRIDGALKMVRTYMLTEVLGVELPIGWWATTECRNKKCCSPYCLVGLPRGAVMDRSYAAGARPNATGYADRLSQIVAQGFTKLGFEGARFVREEGISIPSEKAGNLLGVSKSTVCRARRGKTWRVVHPNASVFAWAAAVS